MVDDGDDGDEHRMEGGEDEEMYHSCIHLYGEKRKESKSQMSIVLAGAFDEAMLFVQGLNC